MVHAREARTRTHFGWQQLFPVLIHASPYRCQDRIAKPESTCGISWGWMAAVDQ